MKSHGSSMKLKKLHEEDFNQWIETTKKQIQENRFNEVDWENLLEELEEMGKSEKKALVSHLMILIAHLLKLKVQHDAPESMKKSWYDSVDEHRSRLIFDLAKIPSLQSYLQEGIKEAYERGRTLAIKQGKRADFGVRKPQESEYPRECPFTPIQLSDEDFYP
ncbi:DUF29 domain-containing protein [Aphanothece sacrum]|uniref:DUF29 domain-containing protein n=1 Tax=Aphanothece sacrum FPU1 TaxID=1920663 RepID=A0A401IJ18_APHSA|nr:DUF29 domain-containing protein [Aphanothece sacrum]GBF81293.1 hypothetical protein AsFPU1_2705 [Aphanothece sacrum FPU1]GBF83357.1 hypothetical protein AsFPU3_0399 [Aphanothece sacrum FPU3]